MIEEYSAELKATLTTSKLVKDLEILDEFVTFTASESKIIRDKYSFH